MKVIVTYSHFTASQHEDVMDQLESENLVKVPNCCSVYQRQVLQKRLSPGQALILKSVVYGFLVQTNMLHIRRTFYGL